MLFTKLKLNYFGRFQNREIELKPGINLIYGDNEAGKSTLHTFIRGMLFGIERLRGRGSASKEDIYTRYLPWDYPGAYSGSMDISIGEKEYRLQRSFHANDKYFKILDLSTGREIKLKEGLISELIPGLTEGAYKNTISIEQLKAQTDSELAVQLRNYIANLSIAKSKEVNVAKAVSILTEQRKQLEPSQNTTVLKALQAEIEEGLIKEERIDTLTIKLRELLAQEQLIQEQKEAVLKTIDNEAAKRMEQLPAILEKYRAYKELLKQENSLAGQRKELEAKIVVWEKEQLVTASLKEEISELQKLQAVLLEQEGLELEFQREQEQLSKAGRTKQLMCLVPACALALILLIATGFHPVGVGIGAIIVAAGILGYVILSSKIKKNIQAWQAKLSTHRQQKELEQTKIKNILHKNGACNAEELQGKQEEALKNSFALQHAKEQQKELDLRKTELEDNRDTYYDIIMKYVQYFIPQEELTELTMQKLQEVILKRKQDTSGSLAEISRQQESCRLTIEKLKWEIAGLEGNEEELLKNKERYRELEQKQKEDGVELEAVKLALSSIQELSADIHDSFGQQLNTAVSDVISEVTGGKYSDIKVDEKLEVKVGWNGAYVLLERLSAGTIDQIYFALRMAVADLLLGQGEVPLLLDDSFILYDDTRVRAALTKLAERKQVILFTCHRREQRLLKELGLPYHMVDLSCN